MKKEFDRWVIGFCDKWGITLLRVSLGIVYLWFGVLKIAGVSPVGELIQALYPFLPEPHFMIFLGVWEVVIGLGLLLNKFLRTTLVLLWLQMGGIMIGPLIKYSLFFQSSNPLLLNLNGEFVVKNLVIIAASLAIAGQLSKAGTSRT